MSRNVFVDYRFSLGEIISLNMWRNKNKKIKESFSFTDIPFPVLLWWEKTKRKTGQKHNGVYIFSKDVK